MSTEGDRPGSEGVGTADEATTGDPRVGLDPEAPIVPLTVAELIGDPPPPARVDGGPSAAGWALLAVLGIAALVLVAAIIHADIPTLADEGWQDNALYAAAGGLGVLGLALASVAWTLPTGRTRSATPRALTLVAVLAAFAGAIVVGLAGQQGGRTSATVIGVAGGASADASTFAASADGSQGEPPVGLQNAFEPGALTDAAIPIVSRTLVEISLNATGRELVAREMGCTPGDLTGREVTGTATGGTWAEPLVMVNPPLRQNGEPIARCAQILVRLPVQAGLARPAT